mmetsp:Transcript_47324/g.51099  ORF Transcript_47324/g.51099 Transcript_47324/m.51099 type:complete len:1022 (-) Transcript_47324:154-3219(-)
MLFSVAVFLIHRSYPLLIKTHLSGFNTLWGQLLSVTTFTLTFFVNQSYSLWRKCMELSRRLQGRLHDVNMNMASHAARKVPSNPNEKSTYTVSSRQILELMSRYTRLFNLLTYASFTRSHRPILTPRGLRRLVERGLMTATEREVLVDAAIPATQRHSVVLMWMIRLFVEGRGSGHIQGGHGFESETMHKFHIIRSQYGAIGDELQGRMPLAYAHLVQVLVDLILWMFPFMAFSTGMSPLLVVVGTGLLTISYQGLFDLAKQFLDPYDNESYGRGEDPLCVDTLIAETNAGSIRWLYGFEELPFSAQRLNDGELYEYLLPVRGYSVEELDQMEEERIERERQLEEQRKREDEEAAAAEAERVEKESEENSEEIETIDKSDVDNDKNKIIDDEKNSEMSFTEFESLPILETVTNTKIPASDAITAVKSTPSDGNKTIIEIKEPPSSFSPESLQNVNTSSSISIEHSPDSDASAKISSTTEETRPVHTVTTLATDGSLISSFKPTETIRSFREEPVPSGMQTSNYLATLKKQNDKIEALLAAADLDQNDFIPEMVDLEAYEDLPWLDEVGLDGQEFRLSQQLAGENWVDESENIEIKNITREEYDESLHKIEENAENEPKETIQILSAIPGAKTDGKLYTVTERKKKKDPVYDQTRLDSISQLWGLPPEDPSSLSEYEPPGKIDDVDFSSVSQLWGGGGEGIALSDATSTSKKNTRPDESEIAGLGSFGGISEIWGSTNDFQYDRDDRQLNKSSLNETTVDGGGSWDKEVSDDEIGTFAGLPWHDEKEYRLSEMLADEGWAIGSDTDSISPMSTEDYNKQVQEIMTQAEEELRETEAILLSKPGTDPVGWDYDDEQLIPMSNTSNTEDVDENEVELGNKNENGNKTFIEDADLAVLEMDVELDSDSDTVYDDGTNNDTNPLQTGQDEGTEATLINEIRDDPISNTVEINNVEILEGDLEDDSKKDPENDYIVPASETEPNSDGDNGKDSGRDKVQHILLEGQEENSITEDTDDKGNLIGDDKH